MIETCRNLTLLEWGPISSNYLSEGKNFERWSIDSITASKNNLLADISIQNISVENSARDKFHLPVYPALEFTSQLQIIYMHLWAGYKQKTKEVWMLQSSFKASHPIFDADSISVKMEVEKIRLRNGALYCTANHQVSDSGGGLFEIWIKAWMPAF